MKLYFQRVASRKKANCFEPEIDHLSLEAAKEHASHCGKFLRKWQEIRKQKELEAKQSNNGFNLFD